jgi:outer membrane protein TolC
MKRTLPLLLLLVAGAPARGDEVPLTLRQCLERAKVAALEIREGRHLPMIASTRVVEAESEFDHLFSFQTSGGVTKVPPSTVFEDEDGIREQHFAGEAGISQKVKTGGIYSFGFQTRRLHTESGFFRASTLWTSDLALSVAQPLLRGAGTEYNESRTRLAEAEVRRAGHEYRGILHATLAAVECAYWRLVFRREDLKVKEHSKEVATELERVASRRLDAGAGTRVDLVQAEAGVAEREKDLILAAAAVRHAEDILRYFVFPFPDDTQQDVRIVPTDRVDENPAALSDSPADRIGTAFEHRPDVLAMKERLLAAGIRVDQTDNELLPRLDAFGTYGYSAIDDTFTHSLDELREFDFPAWEVGLVFEIPIGNRAAEARHRRALLERSRSIAAFESLENDVIIEIRLALRNLETARRAILASRKARIATEAQLQAEIDLFRADKSTAYNLLTVEEDLAEAQSDELFAQVAHQIAWVDLEVATGTYLESRRLLGEPEEPAPLSTSTGE